MKQNLKARIITGAILLSALAFAIIMGGWVFSIICILCIGIALYEMMHALRQRGHQIVRWPVWAATICSATHPAAAEKAIAMSCMTKPSPP